MDQAGRAADVCQGYAYPFDFPLTASIGSSSRADVTRAIYTVQSVLLWATPGSPAGDLVDGDYGPSTDGLCCRSRATTASSSHGAGVGPQTWGALQTYC